MSDVLAFAIMLLIVVAGASACGFVAGYGHGIERGKRLTRRP